jgi:uncharacterized protein (DUF433 family)
MDLGMYLEAVGPDEICLRGTRVGLEDVLSEHLSHGLSAREIAAQYPTVTLEQVEAALDLFRQAPERWQAYLAHQRDAHRQQRALAAHEDSEPLERVRRLKATLSEYPVEQRPAMLQKLLAEEQADDESGVPVPPLAQAA